MNPVFRAAQPAGPSLQKEAPSPPMTDWKLEETSETDAFFGTHFTERGYREAQRGVKLVQGGDGRAKFFSEPFLGFPAVRLLCASIWERETWLLICKPQNKPSFPRNTGLS